MADEYFFEIYRGKDRGKQKYRWRFVDAYTERNIAKSEEPFVSALTCRRSIDRVRAYKGKKVETFIGKDKKCYWRIKANNGAMLAVSSMGYDNALNNDEYLNNFLKNVKKTKVIIND